jgi:hypothetical protein
MMKPSYVSKRELDEDNMATSDNSNASRSGGKI